MRPPPGLSVKPHHGRHATLRMSPPAALSATCHQPHVMTSPMEPLDPSRASPGHYPLSVLAAHALAGFRLLAWINGIGLLLVFGFGVGMLGGDADPPALEPAIVAFAAGVGACALGLLFSYLTHLSLYRQALRARSGRGHWLWTLLAGAAYLAALGAFLLGCWCAAMAPGEGGDDRVAWPARYADVLPVRGLR